MNMAEMLGKVAKQSSERITSATPEIWQPYIGTAGEVFDREWLGGTKETMPPEGGASRSGEKGVAGGGQMHELNMDILNRPDPRFHDLGASTSKAKAEGGKCGQSQQDEKIGMAKREPIPGETNSQREVWRKSDDAINSTIVKI